MRTAKLFTVTAFDAKGIALGVTKDTLLKAKKFAGLLERTGHSQVIVWDGPVGGVRVCR